MPDYAAGFQLVPPARHFRFGPFQVDSRSGELRKHGIKLKLGQQTFQLLLMLLEHPAEVLLREEIRQKLWPHDTVVEFDHSINAAIQKLRAALGESAGSPLYIETLARRGYRFIGTIEIVPAPPSVASVPTSVPKPVEPVPGPAEKISGRRLRSVAVLAGLAVLTVLTALGIMRPWAKREPVRNWSLSLGAIQDAVVSPDGSAVVYRGAQGLVLRRMNSLEETTVYPLNLSDRPVWSADGSQVLSRSSSAIFRLPLPNGPPVMIAPIARPTRGFAWSPDGAIVMAMFAGKLDTGGLFLVSAAGGDPKRLDLPPLTDGMFFYPEFLPDGKNLLFAWAAAGKGEVAIYLATLEGGSIVRGPILLRRNVASGQYSSSDGGRLLYVQNDNLYGQKLNVSQGVLEGSPEKIISGVYSEAGFHSPNFSVSRNGVLVWRGGHASFAQLTWLDRTGRVLGTAGPPCIPDILRLSPDERRVVIHTMTGYGIAEANRGGFVPLSGLTSGPIWMPDNSHILYGRNDANGVRLLARASAGGPEKELNRAADVGTLLDISRDGQVLLYHVGPKLYSIRLGDPRAQPQFLTDAVNARFSPDSRWIVYSAITNEVREIYALPYPAGGLPTQLSPAGGVYPVWRSDGEEILYVSGSTVCSVRVQAKGGTLHASQPERLFDIRNPAGLAADSTPLAVTHDGSRILFAQGIEPAGSQQTYVMTSWESVLRR